MFLSGLGMTTSRIPSRSKSAVATSHARPRVPNSGATPKVPLPFPTSSVTAAAPAFAVTMSTWPSPVKSPVTVVTTREPDVVTG